MRLRNPAPVVSHLIEVPSYVPIAFCPCPAAKASLAAGLPPRSALKTKGLHSGDLLATAPPPFPPSSR